jgi:hypothetical protein
MQDKVRQGAIFSYTAHFDVIDRHTERSFCELVHTKQQEVPFSRDGLYRHFTETERVAIDQVFYMASSSDSCINPELSSEKGVAFLNADMTFDSIVELMKQ